MSAHLILSADWKKYDKYKRATAQYPDIFLPDDTWEANYLMNIIQQYYPQYTDVAIRLSIDRVKRTLYAGCGRKLFVELVMDNLIQRKPFIKIEEEMIL